MIDDLDDLLGNVDDRNGYKSMKDAENRQKEQTARRSDRNLGTSDEIKIGYLGIIKKYKTKEDVQMFKAGYLDVLSVHWEQCLKLRNILNDLAIPESVSEILKKNRYAFLKIIQNIETNYNNFIAKQNPTALQKKAKADFHLVFTVEEPTQQRINFIVLKELFLRLRELNSKLKKDWNDLNSAFAMFNVVKDGAAYANEFSQISVQAIDLCQSTDTFFRYLAVVVGIPEDDADLLEKDISNKVYFRETMDYRYESLFDTADAAISIDDIDRTLDLVEKPAPAETFTELPAEDIPKFDAPAEIPIKITNMLDISRHFTVKGKSAWNTREPYLININEDIYDSNIADLRQTILFVEKKEDHLHLTGAIKRAIIGYIRDKSTDLIANYEEFIFKNLSRIANELSDKFSLGDSLQLFLYHCGPLTTYRILKLHFEKETIGICFKHIGENKISKYYPEEFIKLAVLKWHQANVNSFDLPHDRIQDFNELKKKVAEMYEAEKVKNVSKVSIAVSQHYLKTGKKLNPNDLMAAKAKELFGVITIPVYQRFIDKTIFR